MLIMNVFAELKGFIRTYARISAYLSVHVVDPETELLGIQLERRTQKLLQVFFDAESTGGLAYENVR